MVASDNNSASTRLFTLLYLVNLVKSFALVGSLQLLCKVIVANTAGVYHRAGWKDVLIRHDQ